MLKLILLLIYIFLILTVIFLERKSPTEALLWVLVLVCLPYLGAILYLIFGSTIAIKLTAFIRKKRLQQYQAEKDSPSSTDTPFQGETAGLSDAGRLSLSDEDCQFIVGGVDSNKEAVKMCYLSMIRSARKRIRIPSPYFIPDSSILDALKTAAAIMPSTKSTFFIGISFLLLQTSTYL